MSQVYYCIKSKKKLSYFFHFSLQSQLPLIIFKVLIIIEPP